MPKMKTRRAAAKRFKKTASGEFKHFKNFKSHILEKKSPKRKRNFRKMQRAYINGYFGFKLRI